MNWLIFGAGAIGTYLGCSLAVLAKQRGGTDRIVFVERAEVAEQVRANGSAHEPDGVEHHPVPAHHWLRLKPWNRGSDAAILALKSYDTQPFLASLGSLPAGCLLSLCLQNGVENEPALKKCWQR
jgi:ketopantoate reductase